MGAIEAVHQGYKYATPQTPKILVKGTSAIICDYWVPHLQFLQKQFYSP